MIPLTIIAFALIALVAGILVLKMACAVARKERQIDDMVAALHRSAESAAAGWPDIKHSGIDGELYQRVRVSRCDMLFTFSEVEEARARARALLPIRTHSTSCSNHG